MNNTTYHQRNQEIILNRAKYYHESDKEGLRKQARDKYRNLSEENKERLREQARDKSRNLSEENKER